MTLTNEDRVVLENPEMRNDTLVSGEQDGQTILYALSSIDEVAVKKSDPASTIFLTVVVLGVVVVGVLVLSALEES